MTYFAREAPKFISKDESEKLFHSQLSKDGKTLDVTAMHMGEIGAKDIANTESIKDITTLEFGNNLCGPKGARSIAKSPYLKSLTSLNMYYNRIQDDGCKHIAVSNNLLSLRNLNLSNNEIGDEGAVVLAKFLPLFSNLIRLDIRFNRLKEEGKNALLEAQKKSEIKQLLLGTEEGFNVQEKGMKKHTL